MGYDVNLSIIKKIIDNENISYRELARRMNIDIGYLSRVLSGERNPGMKFINGLFNLGYSTYDVFLSKENNEKINNENSENIRENVCNYMNTMARIYNKQYSLNQVERIRRCVEEEKRDRKENKITINGNTKDGRMLINERTSRIANEKFHFNISEDDISFYKRCAQLEAKERQLANLCDDEVS